MKEEINVSFDCVGNLFFTKYKQLDIGDAIIVDENDNHVLIFERKTISDLLSSIKDGRYLEQSFRLQNSSVKNHFITYIII